MIMMVSKHSSWWYDITIRWFGFGGQSKLLLLRPSTFVLSFPLFWVPSCCRRLNKVIRGSHLNPEISYQQPAIFNLSTAEPFKSYMFTVLFKMECCIYIQVLVLILITAAIVYWTDNKHFLKSYPRKKKIKNHTYILYSHDSLAYFLLNVST